jgi:hypothetical protein
MNAGVAVRRIMGGMTVGVRVRDDTDPVVAQIILERLQAMSCGERAEMVNSMNRACEELALAGIRQRHPNASLEEIRMRLGVLRIGAALMLEVFGWDVKVHGY